MNRTLNLYSIFYYNIINIRVLLIIRVLIILKHFGDLNFNCYIKYIYIYVRVCREREREAFFIKRKWRLVCVERERERKRNFKKNCSQLWFLEFKKKKFKLLRDLRNSYYNHFDKE